METDQSSRTENSRLFAPPPLNDSVSNDGRGRCTGADGEGKASLRAASARCAAVWFLPARMGSRPCDGTGRHRSKHGANPGHRSDLRRRRMVRRRRRDLTNALRPIFASAGELPDQLRLVVERIAETSGGSFAAWLLKLAVALAAALVALRLAPLLLSPWRRAQLRLGSDEERLPLLLSGFAADLLGILALLVVAYLAHALWFSGDSPASQVAMPFLSALVYWRLIMVPVDLVLRHREPRTRLIDFGDLTARRLQFAVSTIVVLQVFSTALVRALFRGGMPMPDLQLMGLCIGFINAGIALYVIRRVRRPATSQRAAGTAAEARPAPALFGRFGHPLAIAFVLLALFAWEAGAIQGNLRAFWGLMDTAGILIGIWALERILGAWLDHIEAAARDGGGSDRCLQWHRIIRR